VTALGRIGERHDDEVADARGDLLAAPWAAVGLASGVGLDRPHLGGPAGERIAGEDSAHRRRVRQSRTCHEALSPLGTRPRADGRAIRYNVAVGFITLGVRFHPASGAASGGSCTPDQLLRLGRVIERAGADAVLLDGERSPGAAGDPFVLAGALAAVTSRVLLGCVATAVDDRHPAIVAKAVAALDVCSAGRALACLAPGANTQEGGLDALVEALDIVRAMLDRPAPAYWGRHFTIAGAWNEPRGARPTPTPLGVLLPPPAACPVPEGLGALLARRVDTCFVEVAAMASGTMCEMSRSLAATGIPLVALLRIESGASPAGVAAAAGDALSAGCGGVVVDWRGPPTEASVARVVAAVGDVLG